MPEPLIYNGGIITKPVTVQLNDNELIIPLSTIDELRMPKDIHSEIPNIQIIQSLIVKGIE